MLIIDPSAIISPLADLERSVKGTLIQIGANSVVDAFVKIKPAGGTGDVVIGTSVYINSGTTIYTGHGVTIGNDTLIAANCTLAPTNHEFRDPETPIRLQGFQPSRGGIMIGRDVWIGANTVILDGAMIGDGCVIGAGSVVREKLPPYGIYAGTPLRKMSERG